MTQARTGPATIDPPGDHETVLRLLEAFIFVSDEPITLEQIGLVLTGRRPEELRALVDELDGGLQAAGRGIRVEEVAGGFRFATRSELAPWIRIHFRNRNRSRLSAASIETLAVIAYKQPMTAPEIQEIRGVDPQGSIKTLLEKRLIKISGKKKVVGRPFLYTTTGQFLAHFGLASIEDLPPIEDFERLAERLAPGNGWDPEAGGGMADRAGSDPLEQGGEDGEDDLEDRFAGGLPKPSGHDAEEE